MGYQSGAARAVVKRLLPHGDSANAWSTVSVYNDCSDTGPFCVSAWGYVQANTVFSVRFLSQVVDCSMCSACGNSQKLSVLVCINQGCTGSEHLSAVARYLSSQPICLFHAPYAGIYARPLGNVVYLMATPTTSKSRCDYLLSHLLSAL